LPLARHAGIIEIRLDGTAAPLLLLASATTRRHLRLERLDRAVLAGEADDRVALGGFRSGAAMKKGPRANPRPLS